MPRMDSQRRLPEVRQAISQRVVPRSSNGTVTAEAAGSSPVVPAIHSKAVRRISFKPSRTQKGHVSRPFVPFSATRTFLFSNECSSLLIGRKDQRHHGGLRCMLRWRDCLCVNVQSRPQSGMPQQLLHHLEFGPTPRSRVEYECLKLCHPNRF
jgi:hypothetical protein